MPSFPFLNSVPIFLYIRRFPKTVLTQIIQQLLVPLVDAKVVDLERLVLIYPQTNVINSFDLGSTVKPEVVADIQRT